MPSTSIDGRKQKAPKCYNPGRITTRNNGEVSRYLQPLQLSQLYLYVPGKAMVFLEDFPFSCRKVSSGNPFLREMLIPFGNSGYVALYEIEDKKTVTILAIRHQRQDDYS